MKKMTYQAPELELYMINEDIMAGSIETEEDELPVNPYGLV